MPRRVHDFRGLTQESRLRLLHAVQRTPGRLLQDLADEAGLHLNTARDHLRVLEQEGLIVSHPARTRRRGRPPMAFSPVGSAKHSARAAQRADAARRRGDLLRTIDPDADHGASLGDDAAHQLDALYDHLEDAGLEPTVDAETLTVGLSPCRYQGAIDADGSVVCSVHARLVRDQLEQVPGPLELRRLHPFVSEERCVIALGLAGQTTGEAREGGVDAAASTTEIAQAASRALRLSAASPD